MATQKPCFLQYFQTLAQVGTSSSVVKVLNQAHVPAGKQFTHDRPFLPLFGVALSPVSGFYVPLAIASQKANIPATFRQLAVSCYNASKADAVDGFASTATMTNPDNRNNQYLYVKLGDDLTRIARYNNGVEIIVDFWNNLDAAATAQQYQDQLQKLRDLVLAHCDKELYISNGSYLFTTLDPFAVAYTAWKTADATLEGIAGIEINSI